MSERVLGCHPRLDSDPKTPAKKLATGPRTEAGKRRSSRNATRHGLFTNFVIEGESLTGFRALVRALRDDLGVTGATAEILIEKLAVNLWRQARLYRAEGAEILRSTQLRERFLKDHFVFVWRRRRAVLWIMLAKR